MEGSGGAYELIDALLGVVKEGLGRHADWRRELVSVIVRRFSAIGRIIDTSRSSRLILPSEHTVSRTGSYRGTHEQKGV